MSNLIKYSVQVRVPVVVAFEVHATDFNDADVAARSLANEVDNWLRVKGRFVDVVYTEDIETINVGVEE